MKKIAILVAAACAMGLGTAAQADGVTLYGSVSTGVVLTGNSTLKAGTGDTQQKALGTAIPSGA